MQHVLKVATPGCPKSVCSTIEDFALRYLVPRGHWLKIVGNVKADILIGSLKKAPPRGAVLEVGTYVGYSALQMAAALPDVKIISLEVDPVHAIVARTLVAFAGMAHVIDIWVGHSEDILPKLRDRYNALLTSSDGPMFRAAFFDQRGSRYDQDLKTLEESLLLPGSVVIADNVLKPGSPLFLWRLLRSGIFHAKAVSMPEFAMSNVEDWMAVGTFLGQKQDEAATYPKPEVQELLMGLETEAELIRARASRPRSSSVRFDEWATFSAHMREQLGKVGITAVPYWRDLEEN